MADTASWRFKTSNLAKEAKLLHAEYGKPKLTGLELFTADLIAQIQHQELHHGPVQLQYGVDGSVTMISTDLDNPSQLHIDSFPAIAAKNAETLGYLESFEGGITVTAAATRWLNPIRAHAGWSEVRTPVENLLAVIGAERVTELHQHAGGRRIVSGHPHEAADEVRYRWLVPESVVQEAITSGLIEVDGDVVRRTERAAGMPDNFRSWAASDPFAEAETAATSK